MICGRKALPIRAVPPGLHALGEGARVQLPAVAGGILEVERAPLGAVRLPDPGAEVGQDRDAGVKVDLGDGQGEVIIAAVAASLAESLRKPEVAEPGVDAARRAQHWLDARQGRVDVERPIEVVDLQRDVIQALNRGFSAVPGPSPGGFSPAPGSLPFRQLAGYGILINCHLSGALRRAVTIGPPGDSCPRPRRDHAPSHAAELCRFSGDRGRAAQESPSRPDLDRWKESAMSDASPRPSRPRAPATAALIALLLLGLAATPAVAQVTSLPGDVTLDGAVNVTDVQACINQALGTASVTPEGDVDRSGTVNVVDVQIIINIALGNASITAISPSGAKAGETITIEGTGFSPTAGDNTVSFNGLSVPADSVELVSGVPAAINVTVPVGALDGPISVSTPSVSLSGVPYDVAVSLLASVGVGPLNGASVEVFELAGGAKGASLGTAVTDASGRVSLFFDNNPGYSGPVLLEATGGSYTDAATGGAATLGALLTSALDSVGPGSVPDINVSPLTSLVAEAARNTNGGLTGVNIAAALAVVNAALGGGLDVLNDALADPFSPAGGIGAARLDNSLICAALPLAAAALGAASTDDLISKLALDIRDGALDGFDGTTGTALLPDAAVLGALARAAFAFADGALAGAGFDLRDATFQSLARAPSSLAAIPGANLPGLDKLGPQLLGGFPFNGAANVATNAGLFLQLSDDVDPATITGDTVKLFAGGQELAGTVSFDAGSGMVRFQPSSPLPGGASVSLSLGTGIRDLAGNALALAATIPFSTATGPLAGVPSVTGSFPPAPGMVLDTGSIFSFELDRVPDPTSLFAGGAISLTAGGVSVPFTVSVVPGTTRVNVTPLVDLPAGATGLLSLAGSVTDIAGNALGAGLSIGFSTAAAGSLDTTAPLLSLLEPDPAAFVDGVVRLAFNERIDPTSLAGAFTLTSNGVAVPGTLQVLGNQGLGVFRPDSPFTPGAGFSLSISPTITDRSGNPTPTGLSTVVTSPPPALAIATGTLPRAIVNALYGASLSASGGSSPYGFALAAGASLPVGLTLAADGSISGTPTATGTSSVAFIVTDAAGATAGRTINLRVDPAPIEATLAFDAATRSETEAATTISIPVTLSTPTPLTADVTVEVTASAITTLLGVDADVLTSSLTFPSGSGDGAQQTVMVQLFEDGLREDDETLRLSLGAITGPAVLGGIATQTITITDDELDPTVTLTPASLSVSETAGTASFSVELSGPTARPVSVALTLGGTATIPDDATVSPATAVSGFVATMEPGVTSRPIVVTIVDDSIFEGDETLTLEISNAIGGTLGGATSATLTIEDDEMPPELTLMDATPSEAIGTAAVTVQLSAASTSLVTFDFNISSAGTADASDFLAVFGSGQVDIGQLNATIPVVITDDMLNEPSEALTIMVTNVAGATVVDGEATLTIMDNDPLAVSGADVMVTEGTGGTTMATITLTAGRASQSPIRIDISTAMGSATPGVDHEEFSNRPVVLAAGQTTVTSQVAVTADNIHEADQTFLIQLNDVLRDDGAGFMQTGDVFQTATQPTVTIQDDDAIVASIADMSFGEGNSGQMQVKIVTTWSGPTEVACNFVLDTADGTAMAGSDYVALVNTPNGLSQNGVATTSETNLNIIGDGLRESNETFTVTMSNPTTAAGTISLGNAVATITIINDDEVSRIETIAGTGVAGEPANGLPANLNPFASARDIAIDGAGNIYIASASNRRVYRVSPEGETTHVAGNNMPSGGTLGGQATAFSVDSDNVAVDGNTLFINDRRFSGSIYEVDLTTGVITLFKSGLMGNTMAIDPANGDVIFEVFAQVVRIDRTTKAVTVITGNGTQGFTGDGGPADMAQVGGNPAPCFLPNGDLLIADFNNNRVRRIDAQTGIIDTIAGGGTGGDGGPAIDAALNRPASVAVNAMGELFIGEQTLLRKVDLSGVITTVAGGGTNTFDGIPATEAQLTQIDKLLVEGGRLLITQNGLDKVREVIGPSGLAVSRKPLTGANVGVAYTETLAAAGGTNAGFQWSVTSGMLPPGLTLTPGTPNATISGTPTEEGVFDFTVQVMDSGSATASVDCRIDTAFVTVVPRLGSANRNARYAAFDADGNYYTARDANNDITIQLVGQTSFTTLTSNAGSAVTGMAYDGTTNRLIVAESANSRVAAISLPGGSRQFIATGVGSPADVEVDRDGNIYIADAAGDQIFRLTPSGALTTFAGTGSPGFTGDGGQATAAQLNSPEALAIFGQTLYVGDRFNRRIRAIDLDTGVITTFAGTNTNAANGGNGGLATAATFSNIHALGCDFLGNVYVFDSGFLRRITLSDGVIDLVAGGGDVTSTTNAFPVPGRLFGFTGSDLDIAFDPMTGETNVTHGNGSYRVLGKATFDGIGIATGVLPPATFNVSYSATIGAVGGSGSGYTWSLASGSLPQGLTLMPGTPSATIAGTPTETGDFDIVVQVTDDQGATAMKSLRLAVPSVEIVQLSAPDGLVGLNYTATFTTTGGSGTGLTWTIASGTLPAGLTLTSGTPTATISGAPTMTESQTFTLRVTDDIGGQFERTYTISTGAPVGPDIQTLSTRRVFGTALTPGGRLFIATGSGSTGDSVYEVDPVTGTETEISTSVPSDYGMAWDPVGQRLVIPSFAEDRIRALDVTSGVATVIAGSGTQGFSGDGGPATAANLHDPEGVTVDASGNIYFADVRNHRVRRIDTSGVITTIAGNGASAFSGDGGQATAAALSFPLSPHVIGNTLYICDFNNSRLRAVDLTTGIIQNVRSVGFPTSLTSDSSGLLYVTRGTTNNGSPWIVNRIDPVALTSTRLVGGGNNINDGVPLLEVSFTNVRDLEVDALGRIYVPNAANPNDLRVVTLP